MKQQAALVLHLLTQWNLLGLKFALISCRDFLPKSEFLKYAALKLAPSLTCTLSRCVSYTAYNTSQWTEPHVVGENYQGCIVSLKSKLVKHGFLLTQIKANFMKALSKSEITVMYTKLMFSLQNITWDTTFIILSESREQSKKECWKTDSSPRKTRQHTAS